MTGDDDPDDRRTYPVGRPGRHPDTSLLAHYTTLAALRRELPVLTDGDFRALLADDANGVAATAARPATQAAVVVGQPQRRRAGPSSIPVAGYLRDGVALTTRLARRHRRLDHRDRRRPARSRSRSPPTARCCWRAGRSTCSRPRPRASRDRRGRRHARRRLERGRRRRLLRRLGQPGDGRRLRQGQRVAGARHDVHADRPAERERRTSSSSRRTTRPATRARLERGRPACRTSRSAGRTSSGRRR